MAYKRKMVYANTSSYRRSQKRNPKRKKAAKTTSFAKRVKKIVLKTCELKRAPVNVSKIEVFHNVFLGHTYLLNNSTTMPPGGGGQTNRIGDSINTIGYKINCLFGQKFDRPNVTWRFMVFQVPKGGSITYGDVFRTTTGNIFLDEPNRDHKKVLMSRTFRPNQAGLLNAGQDEYSFFKKFYVPLKKTYKFGPADNAQTHNQPDIYVGISAYDAFGSLVTDNIGYVQMFTELEYKDP